MQKKANMNKTTQLQPNGILKIRKMNWSFRMNDLLSLHIYLEKDNFFMILLRMDVCHTQQFPLSIVALELKLDM